MKNVRGDPKRAEFSGLRLPVCPKSKKNRQTSRRADLINQRRKKNQRNAPGFNAFKVEQNKQDEDGKGLKVKEVTSPIHGIHSREWAMAIVPQNHGLFKLPIEIRTKIYTYVIGGQSIQPGKAGDKFRNKWHSEESPITDYNALLQLCRQAYVDVIGGSLLYLTSKFFFDNPGMMYQYLEVINPAHKAAITVIHLRFYLEAYGPSKYPRFPRRAFAMIESCESLRDFVMYASLKGYTRYYYSPWQWTSLLNIKVLPDDFLLHTRDAVSSGVLTRRNWLSSFNLELELQSFSGFEETRGVFWGEKDGVRIGSDSRYKDVEDSWKNFMEK